MIQLVKHIGLKCRKVGMIPAKADVEVQEAFKTTQLEPRLEQAKAGQRAVFFVDAAHFVLAPFLGMLWCFARVFIRAPAGRQRFNVLGALNAITHEQPNQIREQARSYRRVPEWLAFIAARDTVEYS